MITIRDARRADVDSIINFQKSMAMETEELTLDDALLRAGVVAVFDDEAKGHYYVAEEGGKVIGSCLTTYEWSDWRNGVIIWLQSVYVVNEARGKGVFRLMYDYIQDRVLRNNDFKGIRLYVEKSNFHARRVYQAMGMVDHHYDMFEWMKDR
jgi:GNAT superfamily N-acetyltransferase